ncbi:hypothetical protein M2271_002575 [Streptomyces sp. LBL]|uniref:hypothetical protein n=1 Tax=Streptomyces sp. LBL TaxID=2940562 RepID=UPI00247505E1|nr:hypothetical protein [Streptomyces sp. LBL]MDH6624771.1 hypothetical protein [Streptomyces sp. LBL]
MAKPQPYGDHRDLWRALRLPQARCTHFLRQRWDQFTSTVRHRARVPLARLAQDYGPQRGPGTAQEPAATVDIMELGGMWSAHCDGSIALTPAERHRLRTLREARNLLAHRVPLDGNRLQFLVDELCR